MRHKENFQRYSSSHADLCNIMQLAQVVCPTPKAMRVIAASYLGPDICMLPFLFYYFLPFTDDQP